MNSMHHPQIDLSALVATDDDSATGGDWAALARRCSCEPYAQAGEAFVDPRCVAVDEHTALLFAPADILAAGRDLVSSGMRC